MKVFEILRTPFATASRNPNPPPPGEGEAEFFLGQHKDALSRRVKDSREDGPTFLIRTGLGDWDLEWFTIFNETEEAR